MTKKEEAFFDEIQNIAERETIELSFTPAYLEARLADAEREADWYNGEMDDEIKVDWSKPQGGFYFNEGQ